MGLLGCYYFHEYKQTTIVNTSKSLKSAFQFKVPVLELYDVG
jgi:hypothetical protein